MSRPGSSSLQGTMSSVMLPPYLLTATTGSRLVAIQNILSAAGNDTVVARVQSGLTTRARQSRHPARMGESQPFAHSAALAAVSRGDTDALQAVVDALARPGIPLAERKVCTLAIATFFAEGKGDLPEERVAVARRLPVIDTLVAELHEFLPQTALPANDKRAEHNLAKRERFILNAALSAMANLAYAGLETELRTSGAFAIMMDALLSLHEDTLNFAAAGVQNMTARDQKCVQIFTSSTVAMEALAKLLDSDEHNDETLINAAGAMINVSLPSASMHSPSKRHLSPERRNSSFKALGSTPVLSPPRVDQSPPRGPRAVNSLFSVLLLRLDNPEASDPPLIRLRHARARKEAIIRRRAIGIIKAKARIVRARRDLRLCKAQREQRAAALRCIASGASRWRFRRLARLRALRMTPPPVHGLPTVWELAGGQADGIAPATTPEEVAERRRAVGALLRCVRGKDIADVCAWLRESGGIPVLVLLMRDPDVHTREAAAHIVANLTSADADTRAGVRASCELLLRHGALGALSICLEPLAGGGRESAPSADDAPDDALLGKAERGAMYAAAVLQNLSYKHLKGANALRTSRLEAQLCSLVLRVQADTEAAADPTRSAALSMAHWLALGALLNLDESSDRRPPTAAQLGLDEPSHAALRAAVRAHYAEHVAARVRLLHAVLVVQRAARALRKRGGLAAEFEQRRCAQRERALGPVGDCPALFLLFYEH